MYICNYFMYMGREIYGAKLAPRCIWAAKSMTPYYMASIGRLGELQRAGTRCRRFGIASAVKSARERTFLVDETKSQTKKKSLCFVA